MWVFPLVTYTFVALFIAIGGAFTFGADASDDLMDARRNRDVYRGNVARAHLDAEVRSAARSVLKTHVAVLLVAFLWPVFAVVTPAYLLARVIREAI